MVKRAKRPTSPRVSRASLGRPAYTYRQDLQWPLAVVERWRYLQGDRLHRAAPCLRCRRGPGSLLRRRLLLGLRLLREDCWSTFPQSGKAPARNPIQLLSLTLQSHRSLLNLDRHRPWFPSLPGQSQVLQSEDHLKANVSGACIEGSLFPLSIRFVGRRSCRSPLPT
jgi:hypothetical protein